MEEGLVVAVVISGLSGLVFGLIGLCSALWAVIELKAMQKSTHQIQYVPADSPQWEKEEESINKAIASDQDDDSPNVWGMGRIEQ